MTPPSAAELLPCPFCGGEATVRTYQTESLWSHNEVTYTQVGCENCDYHRATEPGYEPEALAWWNTRAIASQAPPAGEVEAYQSDVNWWLEMAEGKGYDSITAALEASPIAALSPPIQEAVAGERAKREALIERLMLSMAKAHDQAVSENERGAVLAIKAGNGMAMAYWRKLALSAIRSTTERGGAE